MALPSNVTFGNVIGRFLTATADGSDADRDPDGVPATALKIVFSPNISPAVARDATASPPTFFMLADVSATIGEDGSLLGPDGAPGVRLVASTNPALEPTGWTWGVKISGPGFSNVQFSFQLDAEETVDLATVLQVPPNPGSTLNAWLQAVADAQAARDAAIAAAATSGLPAWSPNTPYSAGKIVISPAGDIVQANSSFTSGATYSGSNWTVLVLGAASTSSTYPAFRSTPPSSAQIAAGVVGYWDTSTVPPVPKGWNGTQWVAVGGSAPVTPAVTTVDNGDGTFTATGAGVTDNGDGTFTITDSTVTANADGTFTLAA